MSTVSNVVLCAFAHAHDESPYTGARVDLASGKALRFADCDAGCCKPELRTGRVAGTIWASQLKWTIRNDGTTEMLVFNLETPRSHVIIPPIASPVAHEMPFDLAGVGGPDGYVLTVSGPGQRRGDAVRTLCVGAPPPHVPPKSQLHGVLWALSEPLLGLEPVPTTTELAQQLHMTPEAVHAAVKALHERLVGNAPQAAGSLGRRQAVANRAVQLGLVHP